MLLIQPGCKLHIQLRSAMSASDTEQAQNNLLKCKAWPSEAKIQVVKVVWQCDSMHRGNETLSWQVHISCLERLLQPCSMSASCMQILPACAV